MIFVNCNNQTRIMTPLHTPSKHPPGRNVKCSNRPSFSFVGVQKTTAHIAKLCVLFLFKLRFCVHVNVDERTGSIHIYRIFYYKSNKEYNLSILIKLLTLTYYRYQNGINVNIISDLQIEAKMQVNQGITNGQKIYVTEEES